MTKSNNKQLILGFTGGIGRAVAVALTKRNIPVVALVRNTEKAAGYAAGIEGLELIEGDASQCRRCGKGNARCKSGTLLFECPISNMGKGGSQSAVSMLVRSGQVWG
jgi:NAD(P)-dependent dehydrogenase (short-subunit alcohol dehydrogenase family)